MHRFHADLQYDREKVRFLLFKIMCALNYYNNVHLCIFGLSTARSSNIGAYSLIDLYQHVMISGPVQGKWDGVTLSII